jgi:hypothetical protein
MITPEIASARIFVVYQLAGALVCLGIGMSLGIYADRHPWFRNSPETIVVVEQAGHMPSRSTLSQWCAQGRP